MSSYFSAGEDNTKINNQPPRSEKGKIKKEKAEETDCGSVPRHRGELPAFFETLRDLEVHLRLPPCLERSCSAAAGGVTKTSSGSGGGTGAVATQLGLLTSRLVPLERKLLGWRRVRGLCVLRLRCKV